VSDRGALSSWRARRDVKSVGNQERGKRRQLTFNDVDEIIPDVRTLLAGHRTVGQWTLAQICRHLADSFHGSMDGFDLRHHRVKRFFMAKRMLQHALERGIPRDYMVNPRLTPPPDPDLDESVSALAAAIDRYAAHAGPLHPHPLFGRMDRPTWNRVHCVHSAHHLRFAIPASSDESGHA